MIPNEMMKELHYLLQPQNQAQLPQDLTFLQTHDISNTLLANLPNFNLHELVPPNPNHNPNPNPNLIPSPPSCLSSNSTSDEADESQQQNNIIIDERRQRRMISNRESARRSRMRKQKHLDELWSQVVRLRNENQHLIEKLSHVSDSHDKVLQENLKLKRETSDLRQMISELQIGAMRRHFDDDD